MKIAKIPNVYFFVRIWRNSFRNCTHWRNIACFPFISQIQMKIYLWMILKWFIFPCINSSTCVCQCLTLMPSVYFLWICEENKENINGKSKRMNRRWKWDQKNAVFHFVICMFRFWGKEVTSMFWQIYEKKYFFFLFSEHSNTNRPYDARQH